MRITGICFGGTSTSHRREMTDFMTSVLGIPSVTVGGSDADMFVFPDGTAFAVASAGGLGTDRSVGFLVDDLDEALDELRAHNVPTDRAPASNDYGRYAHFVAPDERVYELVERSPSWAATSQR